MVRHHGNTEEHSGTTHSRPGKLMATLANPLDSDGASPEKCGIFHKIKWVVTFSRNKTWRAVCSRDLAIKPWTEAECVVDLILVCAVKVSGKFVLYNRAILSSMDPPAPPAHWSDVGCYWVQQYNYNPSSSLTPLNTLHQSSGVTQPRVWCVSLAT